MEILRRELDEDQRRIAANLSDNLLVIAGPGSGKTRLLTHRIGYIVRSLPQDHFKVLGLTFTTEAAKEMKRRVKELRCEGIARRTWIGNFHQFGVRLLKHYSHLIGIPRDFGILSEVERFQLMEEAVAAVGLHRINIASVINAVSKVKGRIRLTQAETRELPSESLGEILNWYESRRKEINKLDFDDLILSSIRLLSDRPKVRELIQDTFKFICIDEFQDTSLIQLELLKLLRRDGWNIYFGVADDDQMLYEWRDARPQTLLEYEEEFCAQVEIMRRTYRCPPLIVQAANALISNNEIRRPKELVSMREDIQGLIYYHEAESTGAEIEFVVERIQAEIEMGRAYPDLVVLARTAYKLRGVGDALGSRRIPWVHVGGKDIERSPFVRLVILALELTASESAANQEMVGQAVRDANHALGWEAIEPGQFLQTLRPAPGWSYREFVAELIRAFNLDAVLDAVGLEEELRNLRLLERMTAVAASETELRSHLELHQYLGLEWRRLKNKILRADDSVKLMNIHQAKGLEFPTVFIVGLEQGYLPSRRNVNLEEERRILFVAMTRAAETIYLVRCKVTPWDAPTEPSQFLAEIPSDLITTL